MVSVPKQEPASGEKKVSSVYTRLIFYQYPCMNVACFIKYFSVTIQSQ